MSHRVERLVRDRAGRPVPYFVQWFADAKGCDPGQDVPDHRIVDARKMPRAIRDGLCWVCGERIAGDTVSFVIGPMCVVNRVSSEPPSHTDCAIYSATHCPFLTRPGMQRGTDLSGRPAGTTDAGGLMLLRNPGVTVVWSTRRPVQAFRPPDGGLLFSIGEPTAIRWYSQGRVATPEEIRQSIDTGLPALRQACDEDTDSVGAHTHLAAQVERCMALLPA